VGTGELSLSDVGDDILFSSLHTSDCPRVDLLVRTSGETRLSDFLLWQVWISHVWLVVTFNLKASRDYRVATIIWMNLLYIETRPELPMQASHASLEFTTVLWPEFSFHTLIALIAKFQRSQASKDAVYLFT
jgi:undecaprenyl pyrophosphate synthase